MLNPYIIIQKSNLKRNAWWNLNCVKVDNYMNMFVTHTVLIIPSVIE